MIIHYLFIIFICHFEFISLIISLILLFRELFYLFLNFDLIFIYLKNFNHSEVINIFIVIN